MSEEEISRYTNSIRISQDEYEMRPIDLYDFAKPIMFWAADDE
jgi:hypothetical protein